MATKEKISTLMPLTIYGVISCFVVLANSFDFWFGEIISGIGFGLEEGERGNDAVLPHQKFLRIYGTLAVGLS